MSDQGKANYTAVAAKIGGQYDHYDKLSPSIRAAYDAGADAVELWLAEAPVDEDMPGNELDRVKTDAQVKLDAHRDEIDRLRDQAQKALAAEGERTAERDQARAELAEIRGFYDNLIEEILKNPGDEYDYDEAADAIAVRYVRDLELTARRSTALRAACEGLERICMGTADEADSSSIAEKALFAAIGHMSVSAIGTEPEPDHRALLVRAVRELADSGSPQQGCLADELARDGGIEL